MKFEPNDDAGRKTRSIGVEPRGRHSSKALECSRYVRITTCAFPWALLLAFTFSVILDGCGQTTTVGRRATRPTVEAVKPSRSTTSIDSFARALLEAYLDTGLAAAESLGGTASVAIWQVGAPNPIVRGDGAGRGRMWSMSKAIVTIAALRTLGEHPEAVVRDAMVDAITRSDNCAIRRVILALQERLGTSGAVHAFNAVLADAGAHVTHFPTLSPAESACNAYLSRHRGAYRGDIFGPALQFGTDEWTVRDAVAFAHALAEGAYGAPGRTLDALMRRPKQSPLEGPPLPNLPLDWGAGSVFPADWMPAWKGGWGGSRSRPPHFLAGQLVTLTVKGSHVAAAATFSPSQEPPNDNPAITRAPRALEAMFWAVRHAVAKSEKHGWAMGGAMPTQR
jgi:hypothetical protein